MLRFCNFRRSRLIGHGEGRLVSFISARKCAADRADDAVEDIPYGISQPGRRQREAEHGADDRVQWLEMGELEEDDRGHREDYD